MPLPMLFGGGGAPRYEIVNSLVFRGAQSLTKTQTLSGQWGFSVWVRRNKLSAVCPILGSYLQFNVNDTITAGAYTSTAVFRDPTAWLHLLIGYSYAAERWGLYVNGTFLGNVTASAGSNATVVNPAIGYDGTNYASMQLAEPIIFSAAEFLPGLAFGYSDSATGSWRPKTITGLTWGTTGCYLGKPWSSANFGADSSGQENNWTPNGFSTSDVVTDSPTNVYATLNPLPPSTGTLKNGNLLLSGTSKEAHGTLPCTVAGKWIWEIPASDYVSHCFGVIKEGTSLSTSSSTSGHNGAGRVNFVFSPGSSMFQFYDESTSVASLTGGSSSSNIFYISVNANNGKMWVGHSIGTGGIVWFNSGDPANDSNPIKTLSGTWFPFLWTYPTVSVNAGINFAQASMKNAAPTGYKALSTANLPATTGKTTGTFTGNANADGPVVFTGAVPLTLSINGNAVTWGTHADKLATGFKIRTNSTSYNSTGTNSWTATYSTPQMPTVGGNKVPSNAQGNP